MNYSTYSVYFEGLADKHEDITHEIGTIGKQGFFRRNIEELVAGFRAKTFEKGTIMVLMDYGYSLPERGNANPAKEIRGGYCILKYVATDDYDGEVEARADCEKISDDIIARMNDDAENKTELFADVRSLVVDVNTTHYTTSPNWKGVFTTFNIRAYTSLCVNNAKWSDLP